MGRRIAAYGTQVKQRSISWASQLSLTPAGAVCLRQTPLPYLQHPSIACQRWFLLSYLRCTSSMAMGSSAACGGSQPTCSTSGRGSTMPCHLPYWPVSTLDWSVRHSVACTRRHVVQQQQQQQQQQRRQCRRASAVSPPSTQELQIRPAKPADYWHLADMHVDLFHPKAASWQAQFLRLDCILSLQMDDALRDKGIGNAMCLVAHQPASTAAGSKLESKPLDEHPFGFFRRLVHPDVRASIGTSYLDAGLSGAVVCDTFGNLIPPRTLDPSRDGAFGWVQRQGYAYISNVKVAPSCRRQGIAVQLMAKAEALAAEWGCHTMALHVKPSNAAALALYAKLGYRSVALEAPWQPFVQGRASQGRCRLMVKRLPATL